MSGTGLVVLIWLAGQMLDHVVAQAKAEGVEMQLSPDEWRQVSEAALQYAAQDVMRQQAMQHGDEYAVMQRESVRIGLMRATPEWPPGIGRMSRPRRTSCRVTRMQKSRFIGRR